LMGRCWSLFGRERKLKIMGEMKIPKFDNEADEANWAYENREALSAAFHEAVQEGRVRQGTLKQRASHASDSRGTEARGAAS